MRLHRTIGLLVITLFRVCFSAGPATAPGEARELWHRALPESQGFSDTKLDAIREDLGDRRTKALLVIRNDTIVYEWYAPEHGVDKKHSTASLAKAIVGGVALAVAMSDGRIALDDKADRFISHWKDDPVKSRIRVRHLGSHTSGIEDAMNKREAAAGVEQAKFSGWQGDFWRWRTHKPGKPDDAFTLARDRAPIIFEPGAKWAYSNPGIAMMDYAVTAALKDAPQKDIRTLLRDRVMRPIGVGDAEWSCGYGKTETLDGLPLVASWGGGSYTARAAARVGRLMLCEGDWDGRRILSAQSVRDTTSDAGTPGPNGMGWWSNNDRHVAALPPDAFWGAGAGGQVLLVVPSQKLIAVRFGGSLETGDNDQAIEKNLFTPLAQAMTPTKTPATAPAPSVPSAQFSPRRIQDIRWAPKETIFRRARGGDNWPITWGDDDALYTAYGDGNGFEPFIAQKLSLGLAKVSGMPPDIRGVNLRAPTIEAIGNDVRGHKASGMLMVDGVLYLLARNRGNAQIAWSKDHGATWIWADWKFTQSFGAPTFINFGCNYAGARDDFVYVVSHDAASAYERADGFVLARVPRKRLGEQAAWEFFAGLKDHAPQWSVDIGRRAPVITAPGQCYRGGVTYHPVLQRYLLVHPVAGKQSQDRTGKVDTRFAGGLVVYEAPEPWGPWTRVYYADSWDVGPGETASFPSKWMSEDGKSLYLVFSGDDCFSVRKATLVLEEPQK